MTARLDPTPAVAALLLAALALAGPGAVLPAVVVAQAVGVLAWVAVTDAPNPWATVGIAVSAAAAADVWALTREGHGWSAGAVLVALAFVASVVAELFRRERTRVAESLAVTAGATVLGVLAAAVVALTASRDGTSVAPRLLAVTAAALAAGRLAGLAPGPRAVRDAVTVFAGALAGAALGGGPLSPRSGALLGVGLGAAVAVADRALALAAADPLGDRARAALRPLAVAVPLSVAAPVAYVTGRLLLA